MVAETPRCHSVPECPPTDEEQALEIAASLFRALGDRTRLAILRQLRERDGLCACDFQCCGLTQPTISHHLKVLRDAGLVRAEKCGLWVHYTLNVDRLAALRELLPQLNNAHPHRAIEQPSNRRRMPSD